jgi:peptidoglycan/LPS O-acetylase OafA/YrhL
MPDEGLSAQQFLTSQSPPKPRAVRIAAGLLIAYGVFGLAAILLLLVWQQDAYRPSQLVLPRLVGGTVLVWIGTKVLQLRRWALITGRVLAVPAAIFGLIAFIARGFVVDPPIVVVLQLLHDALAVAAAITLFSPGVTRAFKQRPDPTQHWITSRAGPPPPP